MEIRRRELKRFDTPESANHRIALPEIQPSPAIRELHILVSSTGWTDARFVNDLLPLLTSLPDCIVKTILDSGFSGQEFINASAKCLTIPNVSKASSKTGQDTTELEAEAAELCNWADLLILAPIDAYNLAKMLHGDTENLLLEIIRSWNVSKKILMVPGMSCLMWENPMTKKQLTNIRKKWNYVQVLQPMLWRFEDDKKVLTTWEGMNELVETVKNQVDLMNIGQDVQCSPNFGTRFKDSHKRAKSSLPPELWTIIIDATGDWELAQRLHIFTNCPAPQDWSNHASKRGPQTYMEKLEWTLLTGDLDDVKQFIADNSVPRWLSRLCFKLIMRFSMMSVLSYLESEHKDLFWSTFGHTFLPDKASSVFGRIEILDFWNTSPSFLTKKYTAVALDGASRQGFVHILDWWQRTGLPLLYTEAALEQASGQGHIDVLEWWKNLALSKAATNNNDQSADFSHTRTIAQSRSEEDDATGSRLKPGKSICYASQAGHADVVAWWVASGIAFSHEDTVAKLASTHGHVNVLQTWHASKESKMIFDNQVLVSATKSGHVDVLEWWRQSGLKVEYKTCDVEEALEDGVPGRKGEEVRRWWARNGLNLGVGTSEWMRTKVL